MKLLFLVLLVIAVPCATSHAAPAEAEEVTAVEPDKIKLGDFVADVGEVGEAMTYLRSCSEDGACPPLEGHQDFVPKRLAWAALLAAIIKAMLSLLRLSSDFWKGRNGKTALRALTVALGGVLFVFDTVALGSTYSEALLLSLSGPGAMVIHELLNMLPAFYRQKDGSK